MFAKLTVHFDVTTRLMVHLVTITSDFHTETWHDMMRVCKQAVDKIGLMFLSRIYSMYQFVGCPLQESTKP